VIVATIIMTAGFLIVEIFPAAVARSFTSDETLAAMTTKGLRTIFLMFPLVGFQIVTGNFFQAIGKASSSIFLSLIRQTLYLIPMLFLFGSMWGIDGLWAASPAADFLAFLTSVIIIVMWWKKNP
jgi:Na+-driven multidrug efflux pump